jgi:hypothetical protein
MQNNTLKKQVNKLDKKSVASFLQNVSINSVSQSKAHIYGPKRQNWNTSRNMQKINVLSQFKHKYEEILLKNFKIVSVRNNDLGRVKDFS